MYKVYVWVVWVMLVADTQLSLILILCILCILLRNSNFCRLSRVLLIQPLWPLWPLQPRVCGDVCSPRVDVTLRATSQPLNRSMIRGPAGNRPGHPTNSAITSWLFFSHAFIGHSSFCSRRCKVDQFITLYDTCQSSVAATTSQDSYHWLLCCNWGSPGRTETRSGPRVMQLVNRDLSKHHVESPRSLPQ